MPKRHALFTTLLASALVFVTSLPTLAASNICDFYAYSDDNDPAGTNVRSGPGRAGAGERDQAEQGDKFATHDEVPPGSDSVWFGAIIVCT